LFPQCVSSWCCSSVLYVLLSVFLFFFSILPRPPTSTLFPYTTLFRSQVRIVVGGLGHFCQESQENSRIVWNARPFLAAEVVHSKFLADFLKADFANNEPIPFLDARQKFCVTRFPVGLQQPQRSPGSLGGCDSSPPFRIRIEPGSIFLLATQKEFRAAQGDIPIPVVAHARIQLPVVENPIPLRLDVVVVIFPIHARQIAFDETPDARIKADAYVGSSQSVAIPVRSDQVVVQPQVRTHLGIQTH